MRFPIAKLLTVAASIILVITGVLLGRVTTVDDKEAFHLMIPLGLIEPDIPRDNPLSSEKIQLGKKLFFDTRLSLNNQISCSTCHDPNHGFAENRSKSKSANGQLQRRNAPSLLNVGFSPSTMWDGRFRTLESQALDPFTPWGDMGIDLGEAIERITRDAEYVELFRQAFESRPTTGTMAKAIASYERSLVSGGTRFDLYLFGEQDNALTDLEKTGYSLFIGRASCINCHDIFHKSVNPLGGRIATFSDNRFHNLGIGYANGRMSDTGKYEDSRDSRDWGSFKTPMLRNVALTAPYMHDGSLRTLEDVIEFYNLGGNPNPNISPGINPLYLTSHEKRSLVAFLRSLTDPKVAADR